MLKGIPAILSPELLKRLCEMGHSDRLVIADGNFPAESIGKNAYVVHLDGHNVPDILRAVLKASPLDAYVEKPVSLMAKVPGDTAQTPIWDIVKAEVAKVDKRGDEAVGFVERFQFYEEARKAYLIITSSETALYGNVILQKGVVLE